ncbi:bromodomain-containing protein DDB_G0280777-like isoform X2 [Aricia agestis]|nr:bromodomain-containing protein DDB_G0280777-like isoform X2 [Aricia agestis]XP_041980681.1 bromodomain-containing protein DDB_G0280777-like isoform X2 [Aricia agestis]
MEFEDELEDLVVLLDVDKNKYTDEYEVLQDLITIEDEGIMDISCKLQQKDFDEYVSSLQKDTAILPQSFCRINQNIKLLNRCRPLTIQVVDCKKFKIFYNDKLAEDLKTRENFNDKFKEILSEKDDDISDDDTIELDVDIADEVDMEDLIRFDNVQENGRGDEQIKCVNNEDTSISKAKEVNSNIMTQTRKDNFSPDNSLLFDSPKIVSLFDSTVCDNKSNKRENPKKHNIFKSSKQTKNKDRSLDKSKYSIKKKDKKKNNHTKSIQLNIEMQKKIADMLAKVEELKNNYYKKSSKTPLDFSNNTVPLNNSNVCHNQMNNINLLPNYTPRPQMYEWHQENYVNMHPLATMQVGRSIFYHSNLPIVTSPYAQIPYYYNNINKAFMQPPRQFSSNNNLHFALQNNNFKNFPDQATTNFTKPRSLSSINFMKPHLQKLAKANENPRSVKIRPIHNYGLSASVKQQEIGRTTLNDTTSPQNSYQGKIVPNKIMNAKNTPHETNLKSNGVVTNKHPTVVKILQNGIAQDNKVKQQEIGRTTINDTTSPQNSYQGKIVPNKIMNAKNIPHETNLKSNSVVTNKHPAVVKILQNAIAQDNKQVNNVPETNINKNLEVWTLQPNKHSAVSTSFHPDEIQEFRRKMFLYENNQVPQQIPTLQNRQIVEPLQVLPKPQNSSEYINHVSAVQNVTEPWRIPLEKNTDKEETQKKLLPQSVKIEAKSQNSSPKHNDKFEQDTQKIIEEPIKKEVAKKETKPTIGEEKVKTTPSFVKIPAHRQSPKNTIISPYQSPVQCVKVETHQSSPKIVNKRKIEEYSKIEIKKKEVNVKPAQPAKLTPNPTESTTKKAENSPKQNTTYGSPASRSLSKVSKKEYSPPVLPIPTFKKTFEMLAKLNLISKYKYKRSRNSFKYAMFDQDKMLSNRSITKDLM